MPEPHSTVEFALIPGHTAYRLSRCGRLQTCLKKGHQAAGARSDRWKDLKGCVNRDGYRVFVLNQDGGGKTYFYLHVLLMQVFGGPCPEGHEVCHRDDNKANNGLDNLYYGTRQNNIHDAFRNGRLKRGGASPYAKVSDEQVAEIRARADAGLRWGEQKQMAHQYGLSQSQICNIIKGRAWNHKS
jgi:hypothetical protein